jgi:hypothetical protein
MAESQVLTGMFPDRASAERAYQDLVARGYSSSEVNLIMSDAARARHFPRDGTVNTELGSKAAGGAGIGAGIGGALGAIVAAVAAVGGTVALPGLGLVIAGPVAAVLAGAGAGGAAGGLLGGLIGWGIPEERIKDYESELRQGGILIGVKPRNAADAAYFEAQWQRAPAETLDR